MTETRAPTPSFANLADVRWLTSPAAATWLDALPRTPPTLADIAALRRELSPARVHLVVQQVELRARAAAKFSAAARMFFTPRGLEQATDEVLASYKAQRFAGLEAVADLCCGIGGDFLALAVQSPTTAIDSDPVMAALAEANARLIAEASAARPATQTGDVRQCDVGCFAAWHIDPDRRPQGRRTTRVELHEPGVAAIDRLLEQNRSAAVKLAPAAVLPERWLADAELEWISRRRECRQLVAWFGKLARHPGQRRATMLGDTTAAVCSIGGAPIPEPPPVERVERYVFEPDAAVLASGLAPTLAAESGIARITAGVGYWTAAAPVRHPALTGFEVEETLPLDVKRLRALLRQRAIGRLEIKKRGVDLRPESLRRDLRLRGDASATLIVTRVAGRLTAMLVRRIGENGGG